MIKTVKPGQVEQTTSGWTPFPAEKYSCGIDPFKTLRDPAVIATVLMELEGVHNPGGTVEMYCALLLPHGESGNPNWVESIAPKGQSEIRMSEDMKEEFPIPALVNKLLFRKRA